MLAARGSVTASLLIVGSRSVHSRPQRPTEPTVTRQVEPVLFCYYTRSSFPNTDGRTRSPSSHDAAFKTGLPPSCVTPTPLTIVYVHEVALMNAPIPSTADRRRKRAAPMAPSPFSFGRGATTGKQRSSSGLVQRFHLNATTAQCAVRNVNVDGCIPSRSESGTYRSCPGSSCQRGRAWILRP